MADEDIAGRAYGDDDSSIDKSNMEYSRMSVEQDGDRSMTPTMTDNNGHSKGGQSLTPSPLLDIHKGRPVRLQVRVLVPVKDHPNFNFVGKLLGPKGNSLKRLQEETQTKMAILGRGSMRDKAKEEELRKLGDPKHAHLNEELHVEITSFAPAADAYGRLAHALAEVKRFLVPDYYDDIRQHQLRELAILNGDRKKGKAGNGEVSDGNYEEADDDRSNGPSPVPAQAPPPRALYGRHQTTSAPLASSQPSKGALARSSSNPAVARHLRRAYRQTAGGQTRVTTYLSKEPRLQYISDEDYVYEEGYPSDAPDVVTKQFPRLRSAPFVDYEEHLSPEEVGDAYEGNGYGPKDFVGEEWVSSRGMAVSRLKTTGRGVSRPVVYREHPYFPSSVTRY